MVVMSLVRGSLFYPAAGSNTRSGPCKIAAIVRLVAYSYALNGRPEIDSCARFRPAPRLHTGRGGSTH